MRSNFPFRARSHLPFFFFTVGRTSRAAASGGCWNCHDPKVPHSQATVTSERSPSRPNNHIGCVGTSNSGHSTRNLQLTGSSRLSSVRHDVAVLAARDTAVDLQIREDCRHRTDHRRRSWLSTL